jgi:hypothetical protein
VGRVLDQRQELAALLAQLAVFHQVGATGAIGGLSAQPLGEQLFVGVGNYLSQYLAGCHRAPLVVNFG